MSKTKYILLSLPAIVGFPAIALAHENYVLPAEVIEAGMRDYSLYVLDALKNPGNVRVALSVALGSVIALLLYFWFQHSRHGLWLDKQLLRLEGLSELLLRLALAASLLFSAKNFVYLGPEIYLSTFPVGSLMQGLLYTTGALLAVGLFSQMAGVISLLIILVATYIYKDYILTYFNYFGEFIALIIFGGGWLSLDNLLKGANKLREKYKQWEILIIRLTYGISILYPAITIKLLHPIIIVEIVNRYGLNKINWLFPSDPLLISLGTGLAQVAVGTALILGFQTRLNTLITFTLMLLSVIFFKEAVWPHYILLALAGYLVINNGGRISLDNFIHKKFFAKN